MFAAAAPASSISNLVSEYGSYYGSWFHEGRQGRIGATLWQRPDLYIENSPVFKADKVTIPLLIMHTGEDAITPYSQGEQWYYDLYRLEKKVWLLSYAGENHTLKDPKNRMDYSVLLGQFFDHYLKGKSAPKWMLVGSLAGMNGASGLELDTSGREP